MRGKYDFESGSSGEGNALMLEIGAKLNASIADVGSSCPEEEFANYRHVAGKIMGTMLLEIMNPIYAAHPGLKPSQLE
jgi:hypothetical protein